MPYFINGWVEATRFDGAERDDRFAWQAVLSISALVDTADAVSERLFGLSKDWTPEHGAVAAGRGAPPHPSDGLRADLDEIARHEAKHGPGEFGGLTHATWQELKAALPDLDLSTSDWRTVFDVVARLEQDERLNDERLRFVVWYDW